MTNERRTLGLGVTFLVMGLLLLTAGGVALAVVPAADCPVLASNIEKLVQKCRPNLRDKVVQCRTRGHRSQPCAVCGSSCRVSLLKRWMGTAPPRP